MAQDSGLAKRGLVVFALLLMLVATVAFIMFRRPPAPPARDLSRAEPWLPLAAAPAAAFPATLGWPALIQLTAAMPSNPGFKIRYTAVQVCARKGYPETPLDVLGEMLDEDRQLRNHRVKLKDGRVVADETVAQKIHLTGLKSFQEWHNHPDAAPTVRKRDNPHLRRLYAALDKLAAHDNPVLKNEALKVQLAVKPK